jgi:holo-[acyl-carrier protein] synthase
MNTAYIGIDIIEIRRIGKAIDQWGNRFLTRIYTNQEIVLYRNKTESLAARFAGKEAVMKALNLTGLATIWQEVEILSGDEGKPYIKLYGQSMQKFKSLGISKLEISLSHSRENAIALVIGYKED